jgi:hypothetical protein
MESGTAEKDAVSWHVMGWDWYYSQFISFLKVAGAKTPAFRK